MIEKVKLSLWDFFTYILSGTALLISIMVHCICKGYLPLNIIMDIPFGVSFVLIILVILLCGMVLEPAANLFYKLPSLFLNDSKSRFDEFEFKKWDNKITILEHQAKDLVNESTKENIFQFCKNWMLVNGVDGQYQAFLGKFGFYRNIAFIFVLNLLAVWLFYNDTLNKLLSSLMLLLFATLYFHRSRIFFRHISITVYSQFISGYKKENN